MTENQDGAKPESRGPAAITATEAVVRAAQGRVLPRRCSPLKTLRSSSLSNFSLGLPFELWSFSQTGREELPLPPEPRENAAIAMAALGAVGRPQPNPGRGLGGGAGDDSGTPPCPGAQRDGAEGELAQPLPSPALN